MYIISLDGSEWYAETLEEAETFAAAASSKHITMVGAVFTPATPANHNRDWMVAALVGSDGEVIRQRPMWRAALPYDIHHEPLLPRANACMALL